MNRIAARLLFTLAVAVAAVGAQAGDETLKLSHGGLERMYRVHVPARYDAKVPAPVVVALHGGGGNMDIEADDRIYHLVSKSDEAGFIAVFPNGYSRLPGGKLATWNAGLCCGAARDRNVDDVGFLREVVADVARRWNVDRNRVFATGMSNGAMMAYRLACDAPDVFRAIAPVAGSDTTRSCMPKSPVAVLHIHAKDDSHVLFGGGAGPDSMPRRQVTDYVSVADTVSKWVRLDACKGSPRRVLDKPGATCDEYDACAGGSRVKLCVTDTGGHSWPGGHKVRQIGGTPSDAISATDLMWEFFSAR